MGWDDPLGEYVGTPWERQPKETADQFNKFAVFLALGPSRNIIEMMKKLGLSVGGRGKMQLVAGRKRWYERAAAYDEHLEKLRVTAVETEVQEMAKRHAANAVKIQEKLLARLEALQPQELEPSDLIKWFDIAVKVERLSRGLATESSEVTGKLALQGGELSSAEEKTILENLEAMYPGFLKKNGAA